MRAKILQVSLSILAALLVSATNSKAATATFDFNTDPTGTPGFFFGGSAEWRQTGGVNDSGFLLITPAANSQSGGILFPDFDAGLVVAAFTFECKIKMGDWTGANCPADGFSLSYARALDEAIPNLEGGGNGVYAGSQDNGGNENNLPEEGTQTGIGIGFDTWGTGDAPYCGRNGPQDLRGISVRVDGTQVAQIGMPVLVIADETAYATDCTTLMTGPRDAVDPGSGSRLAWVPLKVTVDASGKVNVFWKGCQIVTDVQTAYFPSAGRLVFGGRTGGANSFAGVDDIRITTVAAAGGDTDPPTVPANLTAAEVGPRRVKLTWDASTERPDPAGRVAYKVEKDGQMLPSTLTNPTYEDSGVTPAKQYTYRVLATDITGNQSALSSSVTVTTTTEVAGPAFLLGEIYTGISGTPVDNLYDAPKFPDSPDRGVYLNGLSFGEPNFGDTFGENFGIRITGTLTPPATAQYDFFVRSDDASQFFLNTTGAGIPVPRVDAPIAEETGCCAGFQDDPAAEETTDAPIALEAGKEYGFLFIVKEGGGGDWGQVAWRQVGDPTPAAQLQPIRGAFLKGRGDPAGASVTITQQPQDLSAPENETVTFTVAANAVSPYLGVAPLNLQPVYHWFKNGVPINGANSASYTTPLLKKAADNGAKFKCLVAVVGASAFSAEATLTVTDDTIKPTITRVAGSGTFDTVTVRWSEPVESASAQNAANYTIAGLTITAAALVAPDRVRLSTSKQAEDTDYTLVVNNVKDTATPANTVAPGTTVTFHSFLFRSGLVRWEFWDGIGGVDLQALKDDPRYPNNPALSGVRSGYEGPVDYADNHGTKLSGWLTPQQTGDYVLLLSADDHAELYLSTDDSPANVKLIAIEPQWNGTRQWTTLARRDADNPENRSDKYTLTEWPGGNTIRLEASKRYYTHLLFKEGGGGDNGGAAIKLVADPDPAAGSAPIGGNLIGTYIDPDSGAPVITKQPQSVAVDVGGSATFTVEATIGAKPMSYQWRRNRVDIAGATGPTLTVNNITVADVIAGTGVNSGRNIYDVVVSNSDGSATSARAQTFFNGTLFIEAEDFNFDQGQWDKVNKIGMDGPYPGGTYQDKGSDADRGIDWEAGGNAGMPYRPTTQVAAGKPNAHAEGLPRGTFDVQVNHVVGWNDAGEWYNYTRVFPTAAASYNVIGRLSSGGNPINGQLDEVTAGATTATQTLKKLGVFTPGRATANWDTMEYFALRDDSGSIVKIDNWGGEKTIRLTILPDANMDQDYFMFIPAVAAPPEQPRFTKIEFQANGDLLVEWTGGGTLEYTDKLGPGPITWTPLAGVNSPAVFPKASLGPMAFARIRK